MLCNACGTRFRRTGVLGQPTGTSLLGLSRGATPVKKARLAPSGFSGPGLVEEAGAEPSLLLRC